MEKSLEGKAVDIKGKKYVLVSDRIIYFNETYKNGSIETELVSAPDAPRVIVKATVRPGNDFMEADANGHLTPLSSRAFTGYSQAVIGEGMVNKTAALENAETSAVGRALAMMGIGVIDSVASVDEMAKATSAAPRAAHRTTAAPKTVQDAEGDPFDDTRVVDDFQL